MSNIFGQDTSGGGTAQLEELENSITPAIDGDPNVYIGDPLKRISDGYFIDLTIDNLTSGSLSTSDEIVNYAQGNVTDTKNIGNNFEYNDGVGQKFASVMRSKDDKKFYFIEGQNPQPDASTNITGATRMDIACGDCNATSVATDQITFNGATGTNKIVIPDSLASGLEIGENGFPTISMNTINNSMRIHKPLQLDSTISLETNSKIYMNGDEPEGFSISEAGDDYLNFNTQDLNQRIEAKKLLRVENGIDMTNPVTNSNNISVVDNLDDAYSIQQDPANKYLTINTTNGQESVNIVKELRTNSICQRTGQTLNIGTSACITQPNNINISDTGNQTTINGNLDILGAVDIQNNLSVTGASSVKISDPILEINVSATDDTKASGWVSQYKDGPTHWRGMVANPQSAPECFVCFTDYQGNNPPSETTDFDTLTKADICVSNVNAKGNVIINDANSLKLFDSDNSDSVDIKASTTTTGYGLTLPSAQAVSANQVLANDGSGVLSWYTIPPSSGGDINNGGNSFGAPVILGSNDNFDVVLERNNLEQVRITDTQVQTDNDLLIKSNKGVILNNSGDTFGVTLKGNATTTSNYDIIFPDGQGLEGDVLKYNGVGLEWSEKDPYLFKELSPDVANALNGFDVGEVGRSISVYGNIMYVGTSRTSNPFARLHVYDKTSGTALATPVQFLGGSISGFNGIFRQQLYGNILLCSYDLRHISSGVTNVRTYVIDISNPANPVTIGYVGETTDRYTHATFASGFLYVAKSWASNTDLNLYTYRVDIKNSRLDLVNTNTQVTGEQVSIANGSLCELFINNNYLFRPRGNNTYTFVDFDVYDIGNADSPAFSNTVDMLALLTGGSAYGSVGKYSISGQYLYWSRFTNTTSCKIVRVDISNPLNLTSSNVVELALGGVAPNSFTTVNRPAVVGEYVILYGAQTGKIFVYDKALTTKLYELASVLFYTDNFQDGCNGWTLANEVTQLARSYELINNMITPCVKTGAVESSKITGDNIQSITANIKQVDGSRCSFENGDFKNVYSDLDNTQELQLMDDDGSAFTSIKSAPVVTTSYGVIMPPIAGSAGESLRISSGEQLEWYTPSGGGLSFPLSAPSDSNIAPSYSWAGDSSTGFYEDSAGNIGYSSGGTSSLIMRLNSLDLLSENQLRLFDSGSNSVNLVSPLSLTSGYTLTYPTASPATLGSNGQVLSTVTGGQQSWVTPVLHNKNTLGTPLIVGTTDNFDVILERQNIPKISLASGDIALNDELKCVNGTVLLPSINFGDTATGLYRGTANQIRFTNAGVQSAQFDSDGSFEMNTAPIKASAGTAGNPSLRFTDATTGLYRSALDEVSLSNAGVRTIRFDSTGLRIESNGTARKALKLNTNNNAGYVGLIGPASTATNYTVAFPSAEYTNNGDMMYVSNTTSGQHEYGTPLYAFKGSSGTGVQTATNYTTGTHIISTTARANSTQNESSANATLTTNGIQINANNGGRYEISFWCNIDSNSNTSYLQIYKNGVLLDKGSVYSNDGAVGGPRFLCASVIDTVSSATTEYDIRLTVPSNNTDLANWGFSVKRLTFA